MYDDDAREYLKKTLVARVSTIGADGYPHTVAIWFDIDGNDIIFSTHRNSIKVRNAQNNAKGSVSIGGDRDDGKRYYLIRGDFVVEEDIEKIVFRQILYRYTSGEQADKYFTEWIDRDMVTLRLKPTQVTKIIIQNY